MCGNRKMAKRGQQGGKKVLWGYFYIFFLSYLNNFRKKMREQENSSKKKGRGRGRAVDRRQRVQNCHRNA